VEGAGALAGRLIPLMAACFFPRPEGGSGRRSSSVNGACVAVPNSGNDVAKGVEEGGVLHTVSVILEEEKGKSKAHRIAGGVELSTLRLRDDNGG
jgi:hypothetical protein